MRAEVLILGQGLAGTLLAWELERAGIGFVLADPGHATAASAAAAGIINPVTGRRLVKSWRVDTLLPAARTVYREMADALGVPLWHELRVRRWFADERERAIAGAKAAAGVLAPFVTETDADGIWISDAARVDLPVLLAATRARWRSMGRLRVVATTVADEIDRYACVIDCTGRAAAEEPRWKFVPWEFSKGEMLELAVDGLDDGVVLHRRHWLLPVRRGVAWVGATHEPGVRDVRSTDAARTVLAASARGLLGAERTFDVIGQRVGVRVNLPDKRPVAGRHPHEARLGLINGLGAKGALWAPFLARQWVNHWASGVELDPESDVRRFAKDSF